MSVDPVSLSAFRDEMSKIAFRGALKALREGAGVTWNKGVSKGVRRGKEVMREAKFQHNLKRRPGEGALAHTLRKGWTEAGGPHGARGGWFGHKDTWRRNLPIGGKTLTVAGTAALAPSALSKKDPMGRERSRAERVSQLGAGTLGGLMGVGAVMRGGKSGLFRTLAGGLGGSIAGEAAASVPFRKARKERVQGGPLSREDRAQMMGRMVGGPR